MNPDAQYADPAPACNACKAFDAVRRGLQSETAEFRRNSLRSGGALNYDGRAMRVLRQVVLASAVVCGLSLAASEASGSGYSVARFGGEHGHPTTTNATALYYNPAGIAMSDGFRVFVDVNLAWRKASYQHDIQPNEADTFVDDGSVPGANDGKASLFNILASPMIGVTGKFGDFAAGVGFYTPFGGQSTWDKNDAMKDNPDAVGAYDGVQRWYNISGRITSSFITGGVGYHLKDLGLAVGVTGNLILSNTHTVRAKGLSGSNDVGGEGRAILDTKGTDFSMGFGLMHETLPNKLWLGASYQTRPNFSGMKPQTGTQRTFLGIQESEAPVEFETDLPDVIRIGGRFRPAPETELRLFGDYQRWSVLERHVVTNTNNGEPLLVQPREWKDTFGVRLGASQWLNADTELFAGAGFSSNAVPDKWQEPGLPDWDAISVGVGGRLAVVDETVFVALGYTQLIYLGRDTDGKSDYDKVRPPDTATDSIKYGPDSGGKYSQLVGVLNANVELAF